MDSTTETFIASLNPKNINPTSGISMQPGAGLHKQELLKGVCGSYNGKWKHEVLSFEVSAIDEKVSEMPRQNNLIIGLIYLVEIRGYTIIEVPAFCAIRNKGKSKSNFLMMFFKYSWRTLNFVGSRNIR